MVVVYPNGKCWFGVDSKTFKISINEAKGKVFGTISEKGPNFSYWVCFSGKSFTFLLKGVETCCCLKVGEHFKKSWAEGEEGISWNCALTKQDNNFCFVQPGMWKVRNSPWFSLKVGVWLGVDNFWLGS